MNLKGNKSSKLLMLFNPH